MEINTYSNRLSSLFPRGVITGAIYGLFSPVLYIGVMFLVMFVLPLLTPSDSDFDRSFAVSNFLLATIFWGIPSIVPSLIVGITAGALVAAILAIWRKKPRNIYAAFLGFTLGMILMLLINYLIWQSSPATRLDHAGFWNYIFPTGWDLAHFTTGGNLFFIHSLMAIALSTFGAWQINK